MADPAINIDIQQNDDGSVIINLDERRASRKSASAKLEHESNLAEVLDKTALDTISQELLEGIEADGRSRTDWVDNYNRGLELLGLRIETRGLGDKTSTVRHPLLLWAIVKFQAQARGEMLPASGPAKVRRDGTTDLGVADALEQDINHYLTAVATEYYPDTDRGLFYLAYGGTIFKKVYRCPLRDRPVSECVYLPDLIISNDSTDLANAVRVTHRISMSRNQVNKYIDSGIWVDAPLQQPQTRTDSTKQAVAQVVGITATPERWQDVPHEILECYCWLDMGRWGFDEKDQSEGIELPYRVTLDRDSRQIYEVRRNWREDDELRRPRRRFVKWGLVPGIGFLDLGFLHLLGQQTRALTALERMIIDAGMFANFPGGVRVKGARMETNEIQSGPGEFPEIDTGGLPIAQAIMSLPFKGPDQTMLALMQGLEEQGEKTAGMVSIETGDGRTNVPVGTIMAQIEQQTQIMSAVHKRLHAAQQDELELLRELLCEQPELLKIGNPTQPWTAEQLSAAQLVPASDPNVPAHIHRIMQATVLETLSSTHPELYNQREVQRRVLDIARIDQVDELLLPPPDPNASGAPQDPTAMIAMLTAQIEKLKNETTAQKNQGDLAINAAKLKADAKDKARKDALEQQRLAADTNEKDKERESREAIATMQDQTQRDLAGMQHQQHLDDIISNYEQQAGDQAHEQATQAADHSHDQISQAADQQHQQMTQGADQVHQAATQQAEHGLQQQTHQSDQELQREQFKAKAKEKPKNAV